MGANGIVGAAMPLATGAGLAAKLQGSDKVAVASSSATVRPNQGVFHESLNLAGGVEAAGDLRLREQPVRALHLLPQHHGGLPGVPPGRVYEIPGITVDGNDSVEVYLVLREAVDRARAGEGPTLIRGHDLPPRPALAPRQPAGPEAGGRDRNLAGARPHRAHGEAAQQRGRLLRRAVRRDHAGGGRGDRDRRDLRPREPGACDAGHARCRLRPHAAHTEPGPETERMLSYSEALNEALEQEMLRDEPGLSSWGEDVGATGGIFGVSKGLMERYGASACATRRSPRPPSSAAASALPSPGCGRWSRSRSSISSRSPWTCWSTGGPSSASCWAASPTCRWWCAAARRRHPPCGPAQPEPRGPGSPMCRALVVAAPLHALRREGGCWWPRSATTTR